MIKKIIVVVLFLVALFLESSITSIPFLLTGMLLLFVFTKKPYVFFVAFICGILLDSMLLRMMGSTSIFYLLFLLIVLLYDRKFEVLSLPFVLTLSVVGNILYAIYFDTPSLIFQIFVTFSLTLAGYSFIKKMQQKKSHTSFQRL